MSVEVNNESGVPVDEQRLVALALFISFSILNIADLSTDGCYTLGFAVGATVTLAGHPLLALPAAMAAGTDDWWKPLSATCSTMPCNAAAAT